MILTGFTPAEVLFIDSVLGCATDNERDKSEYEALSEAADELYQAWESHQELAIWTLAHHHILWTYVQCIQENPVGDPEDLPPECTFEKDGEWYWSEAAYGRFDKMFTEMDTKILSIAACYFMTRKHHEEIDDPR